MESHSNLEQQHPFWRFVREHTHQAERLYINPLVPLDVSQESFEADVQLQVAVEHSRFALAILSALDMPWMKANKPAPDLAIHRRLFDFVSSGPLGFAVGYAANEARKSVIYLPSFSRSLQLPGFPVAAQNWVDSRVGKMSWQKTLASFWTGDGVDSASDDLVFRSCLDRAGDSALFAAEVAALLKRRKDAARKTPVARKRKARYKGQIHELWLTAALWARTPAGILMRLHSKDLSLAAIDRINADISLLRLTEGRSQQPFEDERAIEDAEREFAQVTNNLGVQ